MEDVLTFANLFSGLIFVGFVYYIIWIPVRDKRAGLEVPKLLTRIRNDLAGLVSRFRN